MVSKFASWLHDIKHKHHVTIPQQYMTHGCSRGCVVLVEYWSGLSWATSVRCEGREGGREREKEGMKEYV